MCFEPRFVLLTGVSAAIGWVAMVAYALIDGSGGASGHPRVWLRIDPEKGWVECGYCDKRYVLKPGSAPADH